MTARTGWLLDMHPDPQHGLLLWLLDEDGTRRALGQHFPVTFYAGGAPDELGALAQFLASQPVPPRLGHARRAELFSPRPHEVLAVEVELPGEQPRLFQQAARQFPDLTYYDADLHIWLRHAAAFGTYPMARCRLEESGGRIQQLEVLDSPWDLDPELPELRVLELEPDVDPSHADPAAVLARFERCSYRLPLAPVRPLLVNLRALLERHDPDLLLTTWGDTWLLPRLIEWSEQNHLPLPLNRTPRRDTDRRRARTFFSYGQVLYRGEQVLLYGRWHIDRRNAFLWKDYGLAGALEAARVTAVPVQEAARQSPGSGISAMQVRQALRQGTLVPWRKQQAENPKTALQLIRGDQGGLVYQPTLGVHEAVGALDFVSMYPSIMVRCNISPETVPLEKIEPGAQITGLVPKMLEPLLEKRVALKQRMGSLPNWDPRRGVDKARSQAHKWLLVCCFGYLGFKNSRFGQIEAHEAVTAYAREGLLRAKEAVEDLGFEVLHMYVDGLWVRRPGASQPKDFEPALMSIAERTGLPVALDGVYRWVAFLPSKSDPRVPVPNRYFGAFQDGSLKLRGLMCRRGDTPAWVVQLQTDMIAAFARAERKADLPVCLPDALTVYRQAQSALRAGRVPPEALLVSLRLTRDLDQYVSPSPAARAARQLEQAGKTAAPGQRIRFIYLLGQPDVHAWDLPVPVDPRRIDLARYRELAWRAAYEVLEGLQLHEHPLVQQARPLWNTPPRPAQAAASSGYAGKPVLPGDDRRAGMRGAAAAD